MPPPLWCAIQRSPQSCSVLVTNTAAISVDYLHSPPLLPPPPSLLISLREGIPGYGKASRIMARHHTRFCLLSRTECFQVCSILDQPAMPQQIRAQSEAALLWPNRMILFPQREASFRVHCDRVASQPAICACRVRHKRRTPSTLKPCSLSPLYEAIPARHPGHRSMTPTTPTLLSQQGRKTHL